MYHGCALNIDEPQLVRDLPADGPRPCRVLAGTWRPFAPARSPSTRASRRTPYRAASFAAPAAVRVDLDPLQTYFYLTTRDRNYVGGMNERKIWTDRKSVV